jgi:hypothetical protein
MNSTLLAQLGANKKFDRETDVTNWYKKYREILENVGWIVQDFKWVLRLSLRCIFVRLTLRFSLSNISEAASSGSVDGLIVKLAAAYMSESEVELIKATFESLRKSANEGAYKLFDTNSKSDNKSNFQLGLVKWVVYLRNPWPSKYSWG